MKTSSTPRIRIALIDDHALVREGVRMLVASQSDFLLVGEAWDRPGTLDMIARERPHVVLLDLDLGPESGIDLVAEIHAVSPESRILVVTGVRDAEVQRRALLLGAVGIVPKEKAAAVMLAAIRKVHAGEAWIDREMMGSVLHDMRSSRSQLDPEVARISSLTPRELEIVRCIAQGSGTADVAQRLGISDKTVRNHLVSIYSKLGVSDRLELAIYAVRHGLSPQPR